MISKLLGYDVGRMSTLAQTWGGVPRRLLEFLDQTDRKIEHQYRGRAVDAVRECQSMLTDIENHHLLDRAPSQFYFCKPYVSPEGIIDHELTVACVPTPTLCNLLGDALKEVNGELRLNFFRCMSQVDQTRVAAGYIFESWFHSFFCAARTIHCHWLDDAPGVASLQGTRTFIHTTWQEVKLQQPPYYWVAPKGSPGIDSALVLDGFIYAFQLTVNAKHESPLGGLQRLRRYLPANLKNASWWVLFAGDSDVAAEQVASQWVGKVPFPTKKTCVPIGWTALDPVDPKIPYIVCELVDSS